MGEIAANEILRQITEEEQQPETGQEGAVTNETRIPDEVAMESLNASREQSRQEKEEKDKQSEEKARSNLRNIYTRYGSGDNTMRPVT